MAGKPKGLKSAKQIVRDLAQDVETAKDALVRAASEPRDDLPVEVLDAVDRYEEAVARLARATGDGAAS